MTASQIADWLESFDGDNTKAWGQRGQPPPGNTILMLAEKYGQLPEAIENQEPYWLNRMVLKMEAEGVRERRKASRPKKGLKR